MVGLKVVFESLWLAAEIYISLCSAKVASHDTGFPLFSIADFHSSLLEFCLPVLICLVDSIMLPRLQVCDD